MKRIKQKIVMIGPSVNSRGGIASVCHEYWQAGIFDRFGIVFLTSFRSGGAWLKFWTAALCAGELLSLFTRRKVSLVHVHVATRTSIWRKQIYCELASVFRVPYIVHLHSGKLPEYFELHCGPVRKWLLKRLLARSRATLVLAEATKAWLLQAGLSAPTIQVLPNFVQRRAATLLPRRLDEVLFIGRLEEEKGVSTLIEAFAIVLNTCPETMLVLAGEGDLARYQALANRLGIQRRVKFVGWVDGHDKIEMISKSAVVVLPSRFEGLPMSLLEAMSVGVPCVATPVGGIPDIITDDVNGRLVPLSAPVPLAHAIVLLLRDQSYNERLGTAARQTVEARFSATSVEVALSRIYWNS